MPARTCSSAGVSCWTTGRVTWPKRSVAPTRSGKAASPGAGQVEQYNPGPALQHFSLPAGITVEGATPPKGRSKWWTEGWTIYPSPVPHQRGKRGGRSLHQHPSRAARRCAGREGDTRGEASHRFFARDAGNPCYPASHAAFRESLEPQRRGARPLREKRCGCRKSGPFRWADPLL